MAKKTNRIKGKKSKGGKLEKGSSSYNKIQASLRLRVLQKKKKKDKNPTGLLSEVEKSAQQLRKGALGKRCQPSSSNPVVKKKPKKKKGEEELKRDLVKLRKKQKGLETQFSQLERRKNRELQNLRHQISQLEEKIPGNSKQKIKIAQNQINQFEEKTPRTTKPEIKNVHIHFNQLEKKIPEEQVEKALVKVKTIKSACREGNEQLGCEDIELQLDEDGYCIIHTHGHRDMESGQVGIGIWFGPNNKLNVAEPFQGSRLPYANRVGIQAATLALYIAKFADIKRVKILLTSKYLLKIVKKTMNAWEKIKWEQAHDIFNSKNELTLLRDAQKDMIVKWTALKHSDGKLEAAKLAVLGANKFEVPLS